mgnify:CR=1 FL=1
MQHRKRLALHGTALPLFSYNKNPPLYASRVQGRLVILNLLPQIIYNFSKFDECSDIYLGKFIFF